MNKNIINTVLLVLVVVLFFLILNDSSFYPIKHGEIDSKSIELIESELGKISDLNKIEELDLKDLILQKYIIRKDGEELKSLIAYNKSLFSRRYKLGQRLMGYLEEDQETDLIINGNIYVYRLSFENLKGNSIDIEKIDNRLNGRIFTLGILILISIVRYVYNLKKKTRDIVEL